MIMSRRNTSDAMPAPLLGMAGRGSVGLALAAVIACSGCGWSSSFTAPRKFQGVAWANPLPPAFSQPPVEPPPAPAATVSIDPPKLEELPPVPAETSNTAGLREEVDQLKAELSQFRSRHDQTQSALESLTASSLSTANRSAAIEAHLALQSSLIDDLRTATQQQQREQWKALDAVSEGIDRMLKRSNEDQRPAEPAPRSVPTPAPVEPPVSPGDIPLQEILSQQPPVHGERGLR